ncbi:MAG: DUF6599 family protein [Bacteroidales bacterium]
MNKIINKPLILPFAMATFLLLQGMCHDTHANQDELFPEIEGWKKPSEIDVYNPGNLWDIINGAADVFMAYDFQELYWGEYINEEDNDIYIVMEIYRQSSPVNAFGVYSQERPSSPNLIDVGVEGYTAPGVLHFFVSDCYVKIRSHDRSEGTEEAMEKIAVQVSGMLDPDPSFPEITKMLPEEGRVEFSEQYVNTNFLGHTFLSEAFVSSYNVDGATFNLFVIEKDSNVDIRQMLIDYYEFTDQDVEVTEGKHRIEDRWNGEVGVVWKDNLLYGYYNLEDEKLKEKYLDLFSKK